MKILIEREDLDRDGVLKKEMLENIKDISTIGVYFYCQSYITKIEFLPKDLKNLDLSSCQNLKSICRFPDGLTELNLSGCNKLRKIRKLPKYLKRLDLSHCDDLDINYNQVNALRGNGCRFNGREQFRI